LGGWPFFIFAFIYESHFDSCGIKVATATSELLFTSTSLKTRDDKNYEKREGRDDDESEIHVLTQHAPYDESKDAKSQSHQGD